MRKAIVRASRALRRPTPSVLPAHVLAAAALALLCSCGGKADKKSGAEAGAANSASPAHTLTLAVVPSADLLPLYYAERAGCYRSLGLSVRLETYRSQLDCDTALLGGRTDGGSADLHRMELCHKSAYAAAFTPLWTAADNWQLTVCGTLRVRNTAALKGRMVAISRQSGEDAALTRTLAAVKLKAEGVYRPQVNDLLLRARMLDNGQVDAAMLRWPYTSVATAAGHRVLDAAAPAAESTALAVLTKRLRGKGGKDLPSLLRKGYNMAVDSLRRPRTALLREVLTRDYGLPAEVADTIKLPALKKK